MTSTLSTTTTTKTAYNTSSKPRSKESCSMMEGDNQDQSSSIIHISAIKSHSDHSTTEQEQETIVETVAILNMLDIVHTLSAHFVCQLCHSFMIDICTFPCGHMFCKYCGLSSLRHRSSCPQCQQETYKPFATRCYEIDSVIDDFYPLLWTFYQNLEKYTEDGRKFVKVVTLNHENLERQLELESSISSSSSSSSSKNSDKKPIQIHSPSDREILRRQRRLVSERKDILLQAPCTSILQKLQTLGFGTSTEEQSIHFGMQTMVWLALCYALWNFIYVFQHPWFDGGLRTVVYSIAFLIAFNLLQMHLFVNPEMAPNLLDFELWEWVVEEEEDEVGTTTTTATTATTIAGNNEDTHQVDGTTSSERNVSSGGGGGGGARGAGISTGVGRSGSSGNSNKSSSESFKDCSEDGDCNRHQHSLPELEQILHWRKEGSLEFEKMFKLADEMMDALLLLGQLHSSSTTFSERKEE